jgi:hypothetical protein
MKLTEILAQSNRTARFIAINFLEPDGRDAMLDNFIAFIYSRVAVSSSF